MLSVIAGFTQEPPATPPAQADNEELIQIYQADQADRQPKDGRMMDGTLMRERDAQRHARVMEIYRDDALKAGRDYHNAAYVMQHGANTESLHLAHEFSMAAVALGHLSAKWISAASYDRLLKSLGRPQRFGTQYSSQNGGPTKLHETDEGVRDSLRKVLKVPSLETAKAREAEMTKRYSRPVKPTLQLVLFAADRPPPAEFDMLDLKAGDTAPEIRESSDPSYPESLRADKVYGAVAITGVIERDGTLTQPKVARTTHDALGSAAIAAIATWKFKPGTK